MSLRVRLLEIYEQSKEPIGVTEASKKLGVSRQRVHQLCRAMGLPTKPRFKVRVDCRRCGVEIRGGVTGYCRNCYRSSGERVWATWRCFGCGKEFFGQRSKSGGQYCSRECFREKYRARSLARA